MIAMMDGGAMGKMIVRSLAKELGLSLNEIAVKLREIGIHFDSSTSRLSDEQVSRLRRHVLEGDAICEGDPLQIEVEARADGVTEEALPSAEGFVMRSFMDDEMDDFEISSSMVLVRYEEGEEYDTDETRTVTVSGRREIEDWLFDYRKEFYQRDEYWRPDETRITRSGRTVESLLCSYEPEYITLPLIRMIWENGCDIEDEGTMDFVRRISTEWYREH